jgi:hypothetical protein
MLQMQSITFLCGHERQLHWLPEHTEYWCLLCADMREVLENTTTTMESDTGDSDPTLLEDDVEWIRTPTPAERRELERVQRMIDRR